MPDTRETTPESAERWALILGVSTGTGAAVARAVARDPGYHVFGIHRGHYMDEARELEREVRATGRQVVMHVADAGHPEGVRGCADLVAERIGQRRVGLLVHSISGASLGHFLSTRGDPFHPRQFEKTFSYLAHSFVYWAQALHEGQLLAPGARLLGLTNALHDQVLHNCGLVAAAKAALEMYVRYLAIELGAFGHRVNLLKFGTVVTPALKKVMGPGALARMEEVHREMIPAGRMCTLEEVARFVSILTREETGWLNGATIDFTGGMILRLFDIVLRPD
jgi:NAD(P)-dependent dehydrogenase (short-subunit alcohol dehydrogenase family)